MEGPGDYPPLDRPRILTSGGRSSDNLSSSGYTEASGGPTPTVNDMSSGRASTPTCLTTLAGQYHSRYLPSAMPGSNFALMNSFLASGGANTEARKSLLPELQHYWSVQAADSFPRYLMARGLYPSYPPLFPAAPESLSLLGPGVACVPGSTASAGPPSSIASSHYHRLLMQNEAFLATVTASGHQALYSMGPTLPPPFLDTPSSSSHAPATPLSLVKQEPKENQMACSDKASKQSDRRSSSFKLDLEHNVVPARPKEMPPVARPEAGYREHKSMSTPYNTPPMMTAGKSGDKRTPGHGTSYTNSGSGSANTNNDGTNSRRVSGSSSFSGESSGSRKYPTSSSGSRKSSSPATPCKDFVSRNTNPHVQVVPAWKPSAKSPSNTRHPKTPTSTSPALSPLPPKEPSLSSSSPDPSVIISIPTSISAPIPLASVQHDGVLLSALASPSSAAASSATVTVKSVPQTKGSDKPSYCSAGRTSVGGPDESPRSAPDADNPVLNVPRFHPIDSTVESRHELEPSTTIGDRRTHASGGSSRYSFGDENSDVVVDSADDSESTSAASLSVSVANSKYERDRAITETIERVAAATTSDDDDDDDDGNNINEIVTKRRQSQGFTATTGQANVTPHVGDSKSSISTSGSRAVSPSSQVVSMATSSAGSVALSGNNNTNFIATASSITTSAYATSTTHQATISAIRYYNHSSLFPQPHGTKRVHAQTFVPEVGVFKGPCTKSLPKNQLPPNTNLHSRPSPSPLISTPPPLVASDSFISSKLQQQHHQHRPLSVQVTDTLIPAKQQSYTPSPSLLSPPLLSPGSGTSCTPRCSSSTSPRALAATPDATTSSYDSASMTSGQSALDDNEEDGDEDSDSDDDSDAELIIDAVDEDADKSSRVPSFRESVEPALVCRSVDESGLVPRVMTDSVVLSGEGGGKTASLIQKSSDIPLPRVFEKTVDIEDFGDKISAEPVTVNLDTTENTGKHAPMQGDAVGSGNSSNIPYTAIKLPKAEVRSQSLRLSSQYYNAVSVNRNSNISESPNLRCFDEHLPSKQLRDAPTLICGAVPSTSNTLALPSSSETLSSQSSHAQSRFQGFPPVSKTRDSRGISANNPNAEASVRLSALPSRHRRCRQLYPRCGSAPPPDTYTDDNYEEVVSRLEPHPQSDRMEGLPDNTNTGSSHIGGNIPVGIAVAQIRPHHLQHHKGDSIPSESATDLRLPPRDVNEEPNCLSSAITTQSSTPGGRSSPPSLSAARAESDVTTMAPDAPSAISGRLPPTAHMVNPSLWLQQLSFPSQSVPSGGSAYAPPVRYPISAPTGFKFTHDAITGQFFLIPTGDSGRGQYPPNLSSVPVDEHRRRDRQTSRPTVAQNSPKQLADKSYNARIISTLRKDGSKQQAVAQPFTTSNNSNSNNDNSNTSNSSPTQSRPRPRPTTSSSSSSPSSSLTPHQHLLNAVSLAYQPAIKTEKPSTQSRGCSPIIFDADGQFLPSQSLSATFKRPQTCSVAIQTCYAEFDPSSKPEPRSPSPFPHHHLRHHHHIQSNHGSPKTDTSTTPPPPSSRTPVPVPVPALDPLTVHCPDMDPIPDRTGAKARSEHHRLGYNPFTDPQILQAADGLELLSTLAEKRPKCSSLDDPKRIFPSPSDSFKSDTTSVLAPEDTLSPNDGETKSGQCTPRRDSRRDLSPKWTLPKKEPSTAASFGDFKTPTGLELVDPVEVRERLAEVQRRYKQTQKQLAKLDKLDSKKIDGEKSYKRGPGRPPKNKTPGKGKSDDDSSSSSSKTKDGHSHKKKRPAEELVDRVFRKLPPVKPAKASRSIHYVKSKTGPFFKRKPASTSNKKNKDLFGFDDKGWVTLHEGKHKKKYTEDKKTKGKKKESKSKSTDSLSWKAGKPTNVPDTKGALFSTDAKSKGATNSEKRVRTPKGQATKTKSEKVSDSVKSVSIVTVKSEPSMIQSETSLGRLGKIFSSPHSSSTPATISASLTSTASCSIPTTSASTAIASIISHTTTTTTTVTSSCVTNSGAYGGLFTSTHSSATFGSMSSILEGSQQQLRLGGPSASSSLATATATNGNSKPLVSSPPTSLTTSVSTMSSLFSFEDSSFLGGHDPHSNAFKRKFDEDSDTDTSDSSPNKKRKPGRPKKINPDKSAGGTETIWAKKSNTMSLLQIPDSDMSKQLELNANVMKPLFLDDEWCRRRSERIFLSEPSPQPSPSPRAEPVWKLSNFMPKNTKISVDPSKENKDDMDTTDSLDQEKMNVSKKAAEGYTPQTTSSDDSSPPTKVIKKGGKGKVKSTEPKNASKSAVQEESSTPSPTPSQKKARRAQENDKMKHQKAKSLHDLTQKVKKKYSTGQNKKNPEEKKSGKKSGRKRKSSDTGDSDSPSSSPTESPITPEPRSAVIQLDDLKDGLKVLYLNDGLFYEGVVKAIQPPDVYGVLTAGQRGNRPHILCQEEILRDAVVDVKPGSVQYLTEGARICAFWSQQFSCLYPGTIAKNSPSPHVHTSVNVEFDDGDSGRIPVGHVRLLPPDFPIIEYEPDPLENLPKRRKPTTPKTSNSNTESNSSKKKGNTKKTEDKKETNDNEEDEEEEEEEDDDDEEEEESLSSESDATATDESLIWKWVGKGTKKPGLKGRAKKEFFKSITRGDESIMVGDSAMFMSTARANCPYIGRVESLWESWAGHRMVRVIWYYHPEETKGGKRLADVKNALFESAHGDENDVQSIMHKCEVLSHAAYKKRVNEANRKGQSIEPNVYYLAGYYDPAVTLVKYEPGVL